jgi:hypothetical protein
MDPALKALIVALTSIRDQADSALRTIEEPRRERSLAWKCSACGYIKHFTRPALAEVAAPAPNVAGQPLTQSESTRPDQIPAQETRTLVTRKIKCRNQ